MDTNLGRSYRGNLGGHNETSRHTPNTRKKTAIRRPAFETRPHLSLGGAETERIVKLRGALASSLPQERTGGLEVQAAYGTSPAFVRGAEKSLGAHLGERALGSRLLDGSLDFETNRPSRSKELPGELLYRQLVEFDGPFGLELPEAREESQRASGTSHPLLEVSRLASYKKRPRGLEPAWSSWMRADSLLSPISRGLGRLKEKLPPSLSPDAGPKSRLSPPSPSRPRENDLASTHASMPTRTSEPNKSGSFSVISRATSQARSSFSGTEARFTEPSSSSKSLETILESRPFTFRDTHLSLIPMNLSGPTSNEVWPIVSPRTSNIFGGSLTDPLEDSGSPRDFYGRAFMHRSYPGDEMYPLFNETSVIASV